MDPQDRFQTPDRRRLTQGRRRLLLAAAAATALAGGGLAVPALAQAATSMQRCGLKELTLTLERSSALPGADRYVLRYTNFAKAHCTLTGFPTLQFRDAKGHSLARAIPDPHAGTPTTVTLAPRDSAYSTFSVMLLAPDACHPAKAARIQVHPPVRGSATATRTVAFTGTVCTARGAETITSPISARPAR